MNLQSGKRKLTAREFKELVTSQARRVRAKDDMQTKSLSVHNFDDHTQELTSTCDSQHRNSKEDNNGTEGEESKCLICSNGGRLLCCAGKGCRRNFHPCCVDPPLKYFPLGTWYCISCVKKKVELGVYAVSEGVESVFDCRDNNYDNEVTHKQKKVEKEYLVKYKGLAHIHNRWIPERVLILEAPTMLAQFKKFNKKVSWKKDWTMPHRLLEKRLLLLPGASETNSLWHNGDGSDSHYEWLVKWMGLDYDQATWELETASCLNSPVALKMISDYERLRKKPNLDVCPENNDKGSKTPFPELLLAPFECASQVHISNFIYVNKLIRYWQTKENAVAIDNQDRILKVVLLVSSFASSMRHPFLIITTHTSLSRWEDEFSCCAPSINVVVYKGSEDVRSFIRTVEFHNEQGAIMFHVLISHCDTADQDIEIFKSISWEAIIIDTSQRSFAPRSLRHITVLSSNKKLLLLRQVEDRRSDYRKFLSLLDPDYEETNGDFPASSGSETEYMKLKERFTKFVAYECKTSAISKFIEYWVPVRLSDLQVEQYCACLLSNSHLLCSTLKSTDSFSTLHDILMATRKCCDHPYLVDWTLGRSIVKGLPVDAHLDVEIELSGKLQLLSRILIEVRKRGLRVLILFQALPASGQISVGDILDDFIHQKFGKDCHARICVNVSPPMRRSILNKFNSKESGKFVLLMETRACSPSTKLSDIDSVILFNSDWDPANDFRALQKVSIDSKFEHLSIFRLYSSCTIEEKILILAKRGLTIDSKINRIKQATCHELLAWGALYLFRRSSSSSNSNVTQYFNTLLDDVFSELLNLLPGGSGNAAADNSCCLRISKVEPAVDGGAYAQQNISLPVELETQLMEDSSFLEGLIGEGHTSLFWMNLFQGKGLFLSIPSSRTRNRQPWSLNNGLEKDDSDDSETTHQEFDEEGINDDVGSRETMGNNQPLAAVSSVQQSAGNVPLTDTTVSRNTKDLGRIHTPLHSEMNKIQVERESTMKLHEELKLLLKSKFEKELREIRKKYDLLLENVEMEIAKKQEEFDARFARVYVSKLLAEFMVEKVNNVVDCTANFQPMEKVSSGKSVFSKGTYQLCS